MSATDRPSLTTTHIIHTDTQAHMTTHTHAAPYSVCLTLSTTMPWVKECWCRRAGGKMKLCSAQHLHSSSSPYPPLPFPSTLSYNQAAWGWILRELEVALCVYLYSHTAWLNPQCHNYSVLHTRNNCIFQILSSYSECNFYFLVLSSGWNLFHSSEKATKHIYMWNLFRTTCSKRTQSNKQPHIHHIRCRSLRYWQYVSEYLVTRKNHTIRNGTGATQLH